MQVVAGANVWPWTRLAQPLTRSRTLPHATLTTRAKFRRRLKWTRPS
ncbi:hypothetical protein GQ600_1456 [Phytophthora cactorum]|nr:hypothetical protein GQ600_1456 [Phytophthora cactorum]